MAASNIVETVVKLRGSREFQKAAKDTAKSVLGIGDSTEQAGKTAGKSWKGVAKWAGGAAAVGATAAYMKDAVSTTENLAKQTMALQRATGLDTKTASAWASVLKVRGVDTNKFQVGLTKLSKTMEAARGGNEKAAMSLKTLGVSQEQIQKGDIQGVLMASADAFANMENPAKKAATAQALFGKAGQALLPMLGAGSAGLQEQLGMADKYGATLDGNATDAVKKQIAAQREWDMAMLGLKVQMGTGLLPALAQVAGAVSGILKVFQPLIKNSTLLQITFVTLTAGFVAYKVASVAATVASWGLTAAVIKEQAQLMLLRIQLLALKVVQLAISAATKAWAAAQWLLNAAMSANPIGLIVIAIVGLVALFVVMYKKVGWFRDGVDAAFKWIKNAIAAVWNWVKTNWPLLLAILTGPFGLMVRFVLKHRDRIVEIFKALPGMITNAVKGIANAVKGAFTSAINWIIGKWNNLEFKIGGQKVFGKTLPAVTIGTPNIPMLAGGGTIQRGGAAIVGEQGPELVSLRAGATVYPTPAVAGMGGSPLEPGAAPTIITKVYLDKRQIAEAVGSYIAERKARR